MIGLLEVAVYAREVIGDRAVQELRLVGAGHHDGNRFGQDARQHELVVGGRVPGNDETGHAAGKETTGEVHHLGPV